VARKANYQNLIERFCDDVRPLAVRLVKDSQKTDRGLQGISASSRQPAVVATRKHDPWVLVRDMMIQTYTYLSHHEICKRLDFEFLERGTSKLFMPEDWTKEYGFETFLQAYEDWRCRRLVTKMISKRRSARSLLPSCRPVLPFKVKFAPLLQPFLPPVLPAHSIACRSGDAQPGLPQDRCERKEQFLQAFPKLKTNYIDLRLQ